VQHPNAGKNSFALTLITNKKNNMTVQTAEMNYFSKIGNIPFEGPGTDNPLAFQWYDPNQKVGGKSMKEYLRFACAYWHSFNGDGSDPFGGSTHQFPWNDSPDAITRAKGKMDAAFEFITKLSIPYYCFHDVDVVDYADDVAE
jgi:xylose isomerase